MATVGGTEPEPILYRELSEWWPLLSAPHDYVNEAAFYAGMLERHSPSPPKRVLELGCGGGNNAFHLKDRYELTLVDRSEGMLNVSRRLNPECRHVVGDMRTVRLGEVFDCVFIHDAVVYLTSLDDVARAARTAREHLKPGGVALFAPDFVRETFEPTTDCGGHDLDGRGLRYVSWAWDPDPADTTFITDYAFLLRERDGSVTVQHDRHHEGLFSMPEWSEVLAAEGFDVEIIPYEHPYPPEGTVLIVGRATR
ncbi:MAG: class I SAM-dependent methyltransferase [Gemmatimonadota bacterium]|nr:class I SAM-dependent methyltransferase [Gemmatimonadota bacterium]